MKTFVCNFIYIFTNCFINSIPFWGIRKFFYRLLGMKIGKGSRINMHCIVMSPWKITIGKHTMINDYVLLDGRGILTIGNNTNISMYSVIYTGTHKSYSDSFEYYTKETKIKDCCWIGTRSVIMPGSVISDLVIIGVQSVFKGVAESNGIYVGNPAILVKYRNLNKKYVKDLNHEYWFI